MPSSTNAGPAAWSKQVVESIAVRTWVRIWHHQTPCTVVAPLGDAPLHLAKIKGDLQPTQRLIAWGAIGYFRPAASIVMGRCGSHRGASKEGASEKGIALRVLALIDLYEIGISHLLRLPALVTREAIHVCGTNSPGSQPGLLRGVERQKAKGGRSTRKGWKNSKPVSKTRPGVELHSSVEDQDATASV